MKRTPRQKVEKILHRYLDLDEYGCQVTTLNVPDLDSLTAELTELLVKVKAEAA